MLDHPLASPFCCTCNVDSQYDTFIVGFTRGRDYLVEQPHFSSELHFVSIAMIRVCLLGISSRITPRPRSPEKPSMSEVVLIPGQTRVGPTRIQHELLGRELN